MAIFATVPSLQINVVRHGKEAPNLVSTLNISAFNVGNALKKVGHLALQVVDERGD